MPQHSWRCNGRRMRFVYFAHPVVVGCNPGHVQCGPMRLGIVERRGIVTVVCNLEGRRTGVWHSEMQVRNGHNSGGCIGIGLASNGRLVYIDIRKVRRCSAKGTAFHGFVWPRIARGVKSIMRILFINHCQWADVLIVRGRCFDFCGKCRAASRALDS